MDEVPPPDLDRVEAERPAHALDDPLHDEHAVRSPRSSVWRRRHGIRVDGGELVPVVVEPVRAGELRGRVDGDDQSVWAIRAGVVQEPSLQREDAAGVVHPHHDLVDLPTLLGRPDEVLPPVLGPLDRDAEAARRPWDQDLLRIELHDLDAEATADVGRHDVDPVGVHAEERGQPRSDAGRGLRRVVQQQPVLGLVVLRHDGPALERHRRASFDAEPPLEDVVGGRHRRVHVPLLL